jgi:beta-glucuronidase
MNKLLHRLILVFCSTLLVSQGAAQVAPLIANINARHTTNLDGQWQAIVDPYDVGALDYRAQPLTSNSAFYKNHKPQSESELVEFRFLGPAERARGLEYATRVASVL